MKRISTKPWKQFYHLRKLEHNYDELRLKYEKLEAEYQELKNKQIQPEVLKLKTSESSQLQEMPSENTEEKSPEK